MHGLGAPPGFQTVYHNFPLLTTPSSEAHLCIYQLYSRFDHQNTIGILISNLSGFEYIMNQIQVLCDCHTKEVSCVRRSTDIYIYIYTRKSVSVGDWDLFIGWI